MKEPNFSEIDVLVAECVLGLDTSHGTKTYSTDITAAWEVVEKLRDRWSLSFGNDDDEVNVWYCELLSKEVSCLLQNTAPTLPLAICLTALQAYGVRIDEL